MRIHILSIHSLIIQRFELTSHYRYTHECEKNSIWHFFTSLKESMFTSNWSLWSELWLRHEQRWKKWDTSYKNPNRGKHTNCPTGESERVIIDVLCCLSLSPFLLLRVITMMNPSSRRISWPTTIMRMNQLPTLACTLASARLVKPREATGSHPPWPWHTFFPGYEVWDPNSQQNQTKSQHLFTQIILCVSSSCSLMLLLCTKEQYTS